MRVAGAEGHRLKGARIAPRVEDHSLVRVNAEGATKAGRSGRFFRRACEPKARTEPSAIPVRLARRSEVTESRRAPTPPWRGRRCARVVPRTRRLGVRYSGQDRPSYHARSTARRLRKLVRMTSLLGSLFNSNPRRRPRHRRRRRPLLIRLLSDPGRVVIVGRCSACGLAFGARRGQRRQVAHVLGVHEEICPGGDRAGEVVFPLGR